MVLIPSSDLFSRLRTEACCYSVCTCVITRAILAPDVFLSFGLNLIAVGFVLGFESEVFVCGPQKHFTILTLASAPQSQITLLLT